MSIRVIIIVVDYKHIDCRYVDDIEKTVKIIIVNYVE